MNPWMKRTGSSAKPTMRQVSLPVRVLTEATARVVPPNVIAVMSGPRIAGPVSAGGIGFEAVAFEDAQRVRRANEIQPGLCRCRMRRALHLGAGIDCGDVVGVRNGDLPDRVANLLLEHGLGLPGHAGIGHALHEEQRGLPMMDVGEERRAILHLGVVYGRRERIAARLGQCRLDLPRDTFAPRGWAPPP